MKKKIIILSLLVISILATACGKTEPAPKEESIETQTLIDMAGNEVTMKKDIQSVAITPIPWASLMYTLDGSADRIVAMNPSALKSYEISFLPTISKEFGEINTDIIGKDFSINMEAMAELNPDLVVVWDYQEEEIKKLGELGIPALAIKYDNLDTLQEGMTLLGKVLNKEEQAAKLVKYHQDTISYFDEKTKTSDFKAMPEVLYLRDKELTIFGEKSVNQLLFDKTGGKNVAVHVKDKTSVNMEQVIKWNPEMIYLSNFDDFTVDNIKNNEIEGQDWTQVKAVQDNKVYKTPIGTYRWDAPCAETPLMMMWMAKVQQPEIFADLDLDAELKDFYKNFYNFELNDEQVKIILNSQVNTDIKTN